ncbi:MAG: ABC transporter permease [Anaerolineales bacterium]|nr:ABC transporter permease [Anaerolineales bacterium]
MSTLTLQEDKLERIGKKEASWLERKLGTEAYRALRGLVKNPVSLSGMALLALFLFVAAAAPVLAPPYSPEDPYTIPRDGYSPVPRPPGTDWTKRTPELPFWWETVTGKDHWVHLMGTTSGQWDIYYGVIWGTRTALRVGVIITLVTAFVGILVGTISAYYGGTVDMVLMRITEIFIAFPFLPAAMTLSAILTPVLGRGLFAPMFALMFFAWTGTARLLRSDILSVREREYVLAARVIGVRDGRIMLRHILPNAIFPTLVLSSMRIGSYVITFAGLSFLGIGAEVGYADWGQLLSFTRDWIVQLADYWYILVYPGVALVLFVLSWNLVGDALRDVLDPRLQGR